MTNTQNDTGDGKRPLSHGAHYAKALFDRHGIPERGRPALLEKILEMAYSPAHRRVKGSASWTFEEFDKLAAHFGETLETAIQAAANQEAEVGTFLCGPIRARCRFWLGEEVVSPRGASLIAVHTDDGWFVSSATERPPGTCYDVRQVLIDTSVSGRRIAVLDDDRDITDSVTEYLRAAGFSADPFSSIAGLTASAKDRPYDAYILDWLIGSTNVRDLIARIRREAPDSPIAVLTGQSESGNNVASDIAETLATQRVLFFEKPVKLAIVTATLSRLLSGLPRA